MTIFLAVFSDYLVTLADAYYERAGKAVAGKINILFESD